MRKKPFTLKHLILLVAAISLIVAACSSDDSTSTTAASSASGEQTKTTPAPEGNDLESAIVKELQTTLKALGYDPGPVDGIYGWGTITALEDFQSDAGITVDGKYGPETHEALEEAADESGYDWDKHAAIEELQQEMADLGYYTGQIDGEYGPETTAAIKEVQAACNIAQDGIYGPDTHSCLLDLGGDA